MQPGARVRQRGRERRTLRDHHLRHRARISARGGTAVGAEALTRAGFILIGGAGRCSRPWSSGRSVRTAVRLAVAAAYRALADYANRVAEATGAARVSPVLRRASGTRDGQGCSRHGPARPARRVGAGRAAGRAGRDGRPAFRPALRPERRRREHAGRGARPGRPDRARRDRAAFAGTARALAESIEAEEKRSGLGHLAGRHAPGAAVRRHVPGGVEEARLHYQQAAELLDRLAQYAGVAATSWRD